MKPPIRFLAAAFMASFLNTAAWAGAVFGLTTANELMIIDSDVPQNVLSIRPITGLTPGESVLGIDVRPATGQLYAITNGPRLLTLDPTTAAATPIATLTADPADLTSPFTALNGTRFSIDFNPVADRLRVVSDTRQNLRINPADGLVTTDTNLAYAPGDVNQAVPANIAAIAYTNNFAGAATTTLFGIDDTTFRIVTQNPPNNGTLVSGSNFGLTDATHPGFDIAPDGTGFVGGRHAVPNTPVEYILATLDPTTGAGESHGVIGDGTIPIRDIAVASTVAFSAAHYAISESGASATITVKRQGFLNTAVSVQYTTASDTASAGSDYTTASGTLSFAPTEDTKTFQVPIINDAIPEGDEFVDLFLTNVAGQAVLGPPSSATLRINANDRADRLGPRVEFIGLTGPSRAISGAVVHFNEDMDPVTATNLGNYRLFAFPRRGHFQVKTFSSAVYDPVERRVTLTLTPFMQTQFTSLALRINGLAGGVTDLAGNLLDGDRNRRRGGHAVQVFEVFSGTTLRFTDRDGDRVRLTLTGGGRLDGVIPVGGPASQQTQFWILDPIALRTTLGGTVQKSRRGDGLIVIAEIIGLDKKEFAPIATNPAFSINRLTFSSNATGLGLQ